MADDSSELLLRMVLTDGGGPLPGQGQAVLPKQDMLLLGFSAGKFSEIEAFGLGISLNENSNPGDHKESGNHGFRRWRSATAAELHKLKFPIDVEPASFKRVIDAASPVLFECCSNRRSFSQFSIVKRKVIGDTGAPQAFLRFDFNEVLVIGLEWDQDDLTNETCKFLYRSLKIQYRMETAAGTLGAPASARWDHTMNLAAQAR